MMINSNITNGQAPRLARFFLGENDEMTCDDCVPQTYSIDERYCNERT